MNYIFQIALNYGSRDEITRGMRKLAQDAADGRLNPQEITEDTISGYLDTAGVPDPDLLIRTSGEQRLSNSLCGSWHIQSFILQMLHGQFS